MVALEILFPGVEWRLNLTAADIKLKWQVEMGTDWGGTPLAIFRHSKTAFLEALYCNWNYIPGEGVFPEKLGGVCGLLSKTFSLFVAKGYNIPYPIYDLIKILF